MQTWQIALRQVAASAKKSHVDLRETSGLLLSSVVSGSDQDGGFHGGKPAAAIDSLLARFASDRSTGYVSLDCWDLSCVKPAALTLAGTGQIQVVAPTMINAVQDDCDFVRNSSRFAADQKNRQGVPGRPQNAIIYHFARRKFLPAHPLSAIVCRCALRSPATECGWLAFVVPLEG